MSAYGSILLFMFNFSDDSSKGGKINITEPETSFFVHATSKPAESQNVDSRYFLVVKVKNTLWSSLSDLRMCICFLGHVSNNTMEVYLTNYNGSFKLHLNNKSQIPFRCPPIYDHITNDLLFFKDLGIDGRSESYSQYRPINIGWKCRESSFKRCVIKSALQNVKKASFICPSKTELGHIYLFWSANISIDIVDCSNLENFLYNWSDVIHYLSHKNCRCLPKVLELCYVPIGKDYQKGKPLLIFILDDSDKCRDDYNINSGKLKSGLGGHNYEVFEGKIACIGFRDLVLAVCRLIMKKIHQQKRPISTSMVHKLKRSHILDTQIERNEDFNKINRKEEVNTSEFGEEEMENKVNYFGNRFWRKLFLPEIYGKVASSVHFDSGSIMEHNISPRTRRSATGSKKVEKSLKNETKESMQKVPLIEVRVSGTNGKIHNRTTVHKNDSGVYEGGKLVRLQELLVQGNKTESIQSNYILKGHKISETIRNVEEKRDNPQKKAAAIKTNDGSIELVNNFIMNSLPDLKVPSPLVSSTTTRSYMSTSVPGGIKTWPGDTTGIESLDDLIMYHTYTDSVGQSKPQYKPIDKFPTTQHNPTIQHHQGNDGTIVGVIKKPVSMNRPDWLTRPYYDSSYMVHHHMRPTAKPQHWDDFATTTSATVSNNGWKKPPKKPVIIILEDSQPNYHHYPSSTTYYDYLPILPKPTTSYPIIITAASPIDKPLHYLPHTTLSPAIIHEQNPPTPIIDCPDVNVSVLTHVSNSNNKEGCGNVNIIINSDITNVNQMTYDAEPNIPSDPIEHTEVPVPNLTPFLDEFEPPESENQETEPPQTEATTTTTTTTKKPPKRPSQSDGLGSYFESLINSTSILNPLTLGFWKLVFTPLVLLLAGGLGFGFLFFPWIIPSLFWRSNSNYWRRLGPADFGGDQNHHRKCIDTTCTFGFRKFHKIFGLPRKRRKRDNVRDLPYRGWMKYRIS